MGAVYNSCNPAIKNTAFSLQIALQDMTKPGSYKAAPTIAAGDWKCSGASNGGSPSAVANLTTLPTVDPAGSIWLNITLSATEMNFDQVWIQGIDQTDPKEWADWSICINTQAATVDVNVTKWLGTAASTPTVAGVPNVNVKTWNDLATVALPLVPTTAGRTLDVSAGGEAGVDWANVGGQSTSVNLSATTTNLVNTLTTYTGNTPQTGDSFARIGATGSSLTSLASAADLATVAGYIDTEIAALITTVGVAGAGLTAAGITAAGVRTAVGLASANLDTQIGDLPTNAELATALGTADDAVLSAIAALVTTVGVAGAGLSAIPKTGYKLASDGTDLVLVAGKTLPNALKYIGATVAGVITDAGTATETFKDFAGTTAVTVTADASGNRSAVVYA